MHLITRQRPVPAIALLPLIIAACATESPAASPSASVTPEVASASATVAPSSTSAQSPSASPESSEPMELMASFDSSPGTSYVTDVVAWSGGFLAIGSEWEGDSLVGAEGPAMWTSSDGRDWEPHPAELGVESVSLVGVVERADGQLLLVGTAPGSGAAPDQAAPQSLGWVSEDGDVWDPVDLPLSDQALVDALDHGSKGYVLSARTPYVEFDPNADQTPGEIWHSTDGMDWTKTHEGASGAVAGTDGFVAIVVPLAGGPSAVVASGDGLEWIASGPFGSPLLDVAPLGGDWLATAHANGSIQVMHSANGLGWSAAVDVNDLTGPEGPKTGRGLDEEAINEAYLAGGPDHAYLMLGNNHCCAQRGWTYGVWVTSDGATWTQATPENAFVTSVAGGDDVTVLGGHLGRGEDATFWLAH